VGKAGWPCMYVILVLGSEVVRTIALHWERGGTKEISKCNVDTEDGTIVIDSF
jgi:hypothetical protein